MAACRLRCLAVAVLMFAMPPAGRAQAPPPLEVRIPIAPAAVNAGGRTVLAYELHVSNFLPREITLNRVEVSGAAGEPIMTYRETEFINAVAPLPANSAGSDKRKIGSGMRAIVYMWIALEKSKAVPRRLQHKLVFSLAATDGKVEERTLEIPAIELSHTTPPVLSAPFKGGTWIAANGPSNGSIHRRAMFFIAGQAQIAQRFAIDWMKLGDDGKPWHGDPKTNSNWYCYGTEVLAVADGVVAAVKDGIPENAVPLTPDRAVPITLETVGGNHVVQSLPGGQFAFYAHLQPGSVRVRPGDRVRRGQVLGLLGNSGNSDAPHLHFQISDRNAPIASEGLPYVLDSFRLLGTADLDKTLTEGWTGRQDSPEKRVREIPTDDAVVSFD